ALKIWLFVSRALAVIACSASQFHCTPNAFEISDIYRLLVSPSPTRKKSPKNPPVKLELSTGRCAIKSNSCGEEFFTQYFVRCSLIFDILTNEIFISTSLLEIKEPDFLIKGILSQSKSFK